MSEQRKIIHLDADAFYASVEMRDNPELRNVPLAVGGSPQGRGVVATCNYLARRFGVRSAMPSSQALRLCPDLQFVKPNFTKYREVSRAMHQVFQRYTDIIEPLSLDEAYLDVSDTKVLQGSATRIAEAIRQEIKEELKLSVSAGVAPNKFLAKIASDWKKPDGLFVITPEQVDAFVRKLPVEKINGVGKVTARKLKDLGLETCLDIRNFDEAILIQKFGKQGNRLISLAQGIDPRPVQVSRERKSLSIEHTYNEDLSDWAAIQLKIPALLDELRKRMQSHAQLTPNKYFVKIKFNDFSQTTLEQLIHCSGKEDWKNFEEFERMMQQAFERKNKPARLLGLGLRFRRSHDSHNAEQLDLFRRLRD